MRSNGATRSSFRAELAGATLSVYRFWRDLGYAIGALSAGVIADRFGFAYAILAIAVVTFISGAIVAIAMRDCR